MTVEKEELDLAVEAMIKKLSSQEDEMLKAKGIIIQAMLDCKYAEIDPENAAAVMFEMVVSLLKSGGNEIAITVLSEWTTLSVSQLKGEV